MGSGDCESRLCNRVSLSASPSFQAHLDYSTPGTTSVSVGRNRSDVREKSYNRDQRQVRGLLLDFLSSSQKTGGPQAYTELETAQQICKDGQVQNVHSSDHSANYVQRRLAGITRFKGCLLPCPDQRVPSKVPQVLFSRQDIPVQCSPLRIVNGSKGVHKDVSSSSRATTRKRSSSLSLHRRLSHSSEESFSVGSRSEYHYQSPQSGRFCDQPEKITPSASPEAAIFRHRWDSLLGMSFLPEARAVVLRETALEFMAPLATKSARQFKRLTGLMAASLQTVPLRDCA